MAQPIEDYAVIGDLQTAALVGRDGSIDWLCLPRFDSGACFAALLGDRDNGHWTLAPAPAADSESTTSADGTDGTDDGDDGDGAPARCARRSYLPDTLILETVWETTTGSVRVYDFMPQRDRTPDVMRIVEGVTGHVSMRSVLRLRFDYGHVVPWMRRCDGHRVAVAGPDSAWLRSVPEVHTYGQDLSNRSKFTAAADERVAFVLTWHPSHESPPDLVDPYEALEQSREDWRSGPRSARTRGPTAKP